MKMNRYTITCNVCGKQGEGDKKTLSVQQAGGFIQHANPRICAENIKRKEAAKEQKKKEKSNA